MRKNCYRKLTPRPAEIVSPQGYPGSQEPARTEIQTRPRITMPLCPWTITMRHFILLRTRWTLRLPWELSTSPYSDKHYARDNVQLDQSLSRILSTSLAMHASQRATFQSKITS